MGPHKTAKSQTKRQAFSPWRQAAWQETLCGKPDAKGFSAQTGVHTQEGVLLTREAELLNFRAEKARPSRFTNEETSGSRTAATQLGQLQFATYRRGHRRRRWPLPDFWRRWPVGSLFGPLTGPLPSQCPWSLRKQHRLCPSWTAESQTRRRRARSGGPFPDSLWLLRHRGSLQKQKHQTAAKKKK